MTMKPILTATATQGEEEGGAGTDDAETGQIMAESSLVHMGFDIARMSMKDKQVLIPILSSLGSGSHVLAGQQGRSSRILVFYHAHLLSSESVLLLQSCLEVNEGDISVWFTSELPVPQRIRDWFVEIPVATTTDHSLAPYQRSSHVSLKNWVDIFHTLLNRWRAAPPPTIEMVKEVKAFVYELLMRNLRWPEAAHHLLDVLLTNTAITEEQRRACVAALANCEATAGGYTIPSYRIPILWESLFLQIRNIVHRGESPKPTDAAARPKRISRGSKKGAAAAVATMDGGEANARGNAPI
jgi:hypothetical protein